MQFNQQQWALILGGSSGFGLAAAKELASRGMSICIVHRDRRGAMARIEEEFANIRAITPGFLALNLDALSQEGIEKTCMMLKETMGAGRIRVLLHSIAFGNLKPIVKVKESKSANNAIKNLSQKLNIETPVLKQAVEQGLEEGVAPLCMLATPTYSENVIEKEDLERTIYSMGTSLLTWTQALFNQDLFAEDARVLGLTSEGNQVAWRGYAAVSAAKVALESISRSIAVEFASYGIRSNIIQPGVTDTPALNAIPGSARMKSVASLKNPFKRLTTPEDVAKVVALLASDEAAWINGALIHADGGEHIGSL